MAQFGRALRSGRRGRVFESRRLDLLQGLMAVSYTHLDVYKRQLLDSLRSELEAMAEARKK